MSLEQRIISAKATHTKGGTNQGLPCSVGLLLRTLPKKKAAELHQFLDTPWRLVPHKALEHAIRAEGHVVGIGVVGKHRRGDCRCGR